MRNWIHRSNDINFLLNPAYCGKIIYSVINKYNETSYNKKFPFSLVYLILPIMLYPDIEKESFPTSRFMNLINEHPEIFVNFGKKARDLVVITNEAVEFLLGSKVIMINDDASLECQERLRLSNKDKVIGQSKKLGKLLALAGSETVIYLSLGVKP